MEGRLQQAATAIKAKADEIAHQIFDPLIGWLGYVITHVIYSEVLRRGAQGTEEDEGPS